MVLLSFSVKKDELLAGTKIRTTRLYTEAKWKQWLSTIGPDTDPRLDLWWKSRTKEGFRIASRPGRDLYLVRFRELNGRLWPCRSRDYGVITPMTTDEFRRYLREEGFEGQVEEFLRFFVDHYSPLEDKIFQSIAFPPVVI